MLLWHIPAQPFQTCAILLHSFGEENGAQAICRAHMTCSPSFSCNISAPKFLRSCPGLLFRSSGSQKPCLRFVPVPRVTMGLTFSPSVCLPICSASYRPKRGTQPPPWSPCVYSCTHSDGLHQARQRSSGPQGGSHHTPHSVHLRPFGSRKFFCPAHYW